MLKIVRAKVIVTCPGRNFVTLKIETEGGLTLEANLAGEWRAIYLFNLDPAVAADYETYSWFTSTHPQSLFVNILIAERLTGASRSNLVNTKLTERRRDGSAVERVLGSADELGEVLDQVFNIEAPGPVETVFAKVAGA